MGDFTLTPALSPRMLCLSIRGQALRERGLWRGLLGGGGCGGAPLSCFRECWEVSGGTRMLCLSILRWASSVGRPTRRMSLLPIEMAPAVRRAVSVKSDVVMRMPLLAPWGSRLPEKFLISGSPTGFVQRLACT